MSYITNHIAISFEQVVAIFSSEIDGKDCICLGLQNGSVINMPDYTDGYQWRHEEIIKAFDSYIENKNNK